jgi:hypothetical protein
MLIVRNKLDTLLVVDGQVFQPAGLLGSERLIDKRNAAIGAAIVNNQLELVDEEPEPGDAVILDEIVGTGVAQEVPHGLSGVPSQVAVAVSHVPATDYGADTAIPFTVTLGEHTATHVRVTATSGVTFKLIVSP